MRRAMMCIVVCVCLLSAIPASARKRGDLPSSSNGVSNPSACPLVNGSPTSPFVAWFDGSTVDCSPNNETYNDHSKIIVDNADFSIKITPTAWMNGGSGTVYTILQVTYTVKNGTSLDSPVLQTLAFKGNFNLSSNSCDFISSANSDENQNSGPCSSFPSVAIPIVDGVTRTQYAGFSDVNVLTPDPVVDKLNNLTIVDFNEPAPAPGSWTASLVISDVVRDTSSASGTTFLADINSILTEMSQSTIASDNGLVYSAANVHYVVVEATGVRHEGGGLALPYPSCSPAGKVCAAPSNDSISTPKSIPYGTNFSDTNDVSLAQFQDSNDPHSGCYDGQDDANYSNNSQFLAHRSVWYTISLPNTQTISIATDGSRFDTRIDVFQGQPGGTSTPVACSDDYPSGSAALQQAKIPAFTPPAAGTYYIMVSETAKPTGTVLDALGNLVPSTGPPYDTATIPSATSALLNLQVISGYAPAAITSPAGGSTLPGASVTFNWTAGVGVTQYSLYVGSTPGAHDIAFVNAGSKTSATVNNIPTLAKTLYVTLYSLIKGAYQSHAYSYQEAGTAATMTSPVGGSVLPGSTVTFSWTTGAGATQYSLYLGTAPGGFDVAFVNAGTKTSTTINNLPTNGTPLYATLYTLINGAFQSNAYTYTEAGSSSGGAAKMISPAAGANLGGAKVTFTWTSATGATQYSLYLGSTAGAHDIGFINAGTNTTATATNIPTNAKTLYVTLYSLIGGTFQSNSYTYKEAGTAATMVSPTPGSTLGGSSVTFNWTAGAGVTQYTLYLGSSPGAHDIAFVNAGSLTSTTVSNIPTAGHTLFVTLYSLINGVYQQNAYTYIEGTSP